MRKARGKTDVRARGGVTLTPGGASMAQFRLAECGQGLLPCHMLEHQASGMSIYFDITSRNL